jgi:hypothetical protein
MALLPAKRDGSLFDVELHRWKAADRKHVRSPISQAPVPPSPAPRLRLFGSGDSLRVVALKQCYAEVMPPDSSR